MVMREMSHISLKCDNNHQRPVCRHQQVVTAGQKDKEIDGGWRGQTESVAIRKTQPDEEWKALHKFNLSRPFVANSNVNILCNLIL